MAMMNFAQGYYPQPTTPVTTPVVWVDNELEARNSYVAPGSTGFFMERQNPRFYVKSATLSGEVASFKIYEFTEIIPKPETPVSQSQPYVTMEVFNNSINELKQLINQRNGYRKSNREGENHG